MADEQNNAASSPAEVAVAEQPAAQQENLAEDIKPIETWTDAEHDEWMSKGTIPRSGTEVTPKQESSEAKAETAPESEPGKEQQGEKPKAERRKGQLDADIAAMERRKSEIQERLRTRAQLRNEVRTLEAELAGKKPAERLAEPTGDLKQPKLSEYDSLDAFLDANAEYHRKLTEKTVQEAISKHDQERQTQEMWQRLESQHREIAKSWGQKVETFRKTNAEATDFADAVHSLVDVMDEGSYIDRWITQSDDGPALAYHLGKNLDEYDRISGMDDHRAARELTKLELQLSGSKSPAQNKKPVVVLPNPPSTLHGRATPPANDIEAAVKENDFETFQRLETARELAEARKG